MAIPFRSLTVFCGARPGRDKKYENLAHNLGKWMAKNSIQLVYGGGSVGLMGTLARAVHENGGSIVGVIPEALKFKELDFKDAQELIVVGNMHERKAIMSQRGEAFLTLPGGFGTLEEIFEMITWRQLEFHKKPLYFLNEDGFYSGLKSFMKHLVHEQFVSEKEIQLIEFFDSFESWEKNWEK